MELPVTGIHELNVYCQICIKVISVFVFHLVKTTDIDWRIQKCCNFCIKDQKKIRKRKNTLNWEIRRTVYDENCIVRCGAMGIQLTFELHAKSIWNNIQKKKGKHTQHDANLTLNEKKKTYTHNRIRHIDTISLGNEKQFTQSTICDFAIFHQRTSQIVLHFGYCSPAQIAMRHRIKLWTCILIYTIHKSQATTTSNKILATA